MVSGWRTRIVRALAEPATRGLDLDDPQMTVARRELSTSKPALRLSYLAWYRDLERIAGLAPPGARVELGSGGGFLEQRIPGLIKSDLLSLPFVDLVCRGEELPFADGSVGALFMVNVLHHIPHARHFFHEVQRVLCEGGYLAMIEPYATPFSRFVYKNFHPEPFDMIAAGWELPPSGPLSGGNDALPWIVFVRDRPAFEAGFPGLTIREIRLHTSFAHLLGGGVLMRSLLPGAIFPWLHRMEAASGDFLMKFVALFATVVVQKAGSAPDPDQS